MLTRRRWVRRREHGGEPGSGLRSVVGASEFDWTNGPGSRKPSIHPSAQSLRPLSCLTLPRNRSTPSAMSCRAASMWPTAARTFGLHCYGCEFGMSLSIVQRRVAMGYYKRMPVNRKRNPFLKRLSFRFAYMKPSRITFLTCLLIVLAGAVFALSVVNMLPENFAELVTGPNQ